MATLLDRTEFQAQLKDYYAKRSHLLMYRNRPLLSMLKKETDWSGLNFEGPVQHGVVQGGSSTWQKATDNMYASLHKRFSSPLRKYYVHGKIDNALIATSKSDKGSFLRAVTSEIDGGFMHFGNETARQIYGDGTGQRGIVGAYAADVITLATPDDVVNYEIGMEISWATSGGFPTAKDTKTVLAVNRDTGEITVSTPGVVPAVNDVIWREGDANLQLQGLAAWLTDDAAALAASFNGVVREADAFRLAGVFYDGTGDTIEDALINAGGRFFREGVNPDYCFVHPTKMTELDRLLESGAKYRSRFDKSSSTVAELGFESIVLHTGGFTVEVVADPYCPIDRAYMLDMESMCLKSADGPFGTFNTEGRFANGILASGDGDSVKFELRGYGNLVCYAPGRNGVVLL